MPRYSLDSGDEWRVFRLELNIAVCLDPRRIRDRALNTEEWDAEQCVTEITGNIWCDSASEENLKVGDIEAFLLDLHKSDNPFVTLDAQERELAELYPHLFQAPGVLTRSAARIYDMDDPDDDVCLMDPMLYVHTIRLLPAFRGKGVGLLTMRGLLAHFSSTVTLAACKPAPLSATRAGHMSHVDDESSYYDPDLAKRPRKASVSALRRYWAKVGFQPLGRSAYMLANVSDALIVSSATDRARSEDLRAPV